MKMCPSCGAEVPAAATRCKECFHDFSEVQSKGAKGLLPFLGLLALMAVIGAVTFGTIASWPTDQQILVEEESQSIVFVRKYRWGENTERIPFSQIAAMEHVIEQNGEYKSIAITTQGERITLEASKKSLRGSTERNARLMGKAFNEVDNTTGFFSKDRVKQMQDSKQGSP